MDDAPLRRAVDDAVASVMGAAARSLPGPVEPLELDSLMVVELVDALEARLPLRLAAVDVSPVHFATREALFRLCRARVPA